VVLDLRLVPVEQERFQEVLVQLDYPQLLAMEIQLLPSVVVVVVVEVPVHQTELEVMVLKAR
jgi:hypothetical protein